jgi:hypothetical protein
LFFKHITSISSYLHMHIYIPYLTTTLDERCWEIRHTNIKIGTILIGGLMLMGTI